MCFRSRRRPRRAGPDGRCRSPRTRSGFTESHLPEDAPNILIVLIDDAGPGLPRHVRREMSRPPHSHRVLGEGIGYNRFHTTAMCSPTRASLLTGRNHHRIGNGQIAELANDWDGYAGEIPKSSALGAEVLKDYGYATAAFGQVAQHSGSGDVRCGAIPQLADGDRLRVLLRLPGRRGVAVRAEPGPQHHDRPARRRPRRRATTSARIWPTTRSAGSIAIRRSSPTSPSSCTGRAGACTDRTTS